MKKKLLFLFYNFYFVNCFKVLSDRIFKIYQGKFPKSLRYLPLKMLEKIYF